MLVRSRPPRKPESDTALCEYWEETISLLSGSQFEDKRAVGLVESVIAHSQAVSRNMTYGDTMGVASLGQCVMNQWVRREVPSGMVLD